MHERTHKIPLSSKEVLRCNEGSNRRDTQRVVDFLEHEFEKEYQYVIE